MKAYRIQTAKVVEPFGDRALDCPIFDKTLAQHQADALKELGLELEEVTDRSQIQDQNEHIIFFDYLYFMPRLLREFVTRSQEQKSNTVCALKPGITTLRTVTTTQSVTTYDDRVEYQLYYVPAASARSEVKPVIIDSDQFFYPVPMPAHMFGETQFKLPMTDKLLVQIEHWTNLWMANVGRILLTGAGMSQASGGQLLKLAIKSRSVNQWTILKQANRVGKNCDIHPTAYIECAVIGDNVTIGAGAVVRSVYVGNGCSIGNNAVVELSVLGDGCNVMNGCTMQMSMAFSGLFSMAKLISASVCGRDTFVGDGVTLTDFRMDNKTIPVMHEGIKVDTLNPIVGSCLGHGVYLGTGSIVAPGRAIPNGLRFVVEGDRVIRMNGDMDKVPGYQVTETRAKA
jgi:carbonic anhydrase/acetyltransferase-like protein (isoleucine patch superfamily)